MRAIQMVILSVGFGVAGQLLLKRGMLLKGDFAQFSLPVILKILFSPDIFLGILCYVASLVMWLWILAKMPLSTAYPVGSLSIVFVVLGAHFLFKEAISLIKWMGILLVFAGVYIVGSQ